MNKCIGYQGYGRLVLFRGREYYIWEGTRVRFYLSKYKIDVGKTYDYNLQNPELEEVIDVVNYRNAKIDLILD